MSSRQIVLDTETTGISTKDGHRIIEIGALELIDRRQTGNHYHEYINPEREVDQGAFQVHGISNEFLADKPVFKSLSQGFLDYIRGAELIIHNAPFDVGFIEHEMRLLGQRSYKITDECTVLDTLVVARDKHPGQRNSLDALCKRYGVNNDNRQLHGALLDAQLLAEVYLAMSGGQMNMFDDPNEKKSQQGGSATQITIKRTGKIPVIKASDEELAAHDNF